MISTQSWPARHPDAESALRITCTEEMTGAVAAICVVTEGAGVGVTSTPRRTRSGWKARYLIVPAAVPVCICSCGTCQAGAVDEGGLGGSGNGILKLAVRPPVENWMVLSFGPVERLEAQKNPTGP